MRIPASSQARLAALYSLDDSDFSRLEAVIKSAPRGLTSRQLTERAVEALPELPAKKMREFVKIILELFEVFAYRGAPRESFNESLREAASRSESKELLTIAENEPMFLDRTKRILDLAPHIDVAAKTASLKRAHERTVCHTRVLTDVRPVFQEVVTEPPVGAIVSHTLAIAFHQSDNKLDTFYVNLDDSGLASLITQLDRARTKGRVLAATILKAGLIAVPSEDHED